MESKKPNLFLVGAPKSGTTYLYNLLCAHPDIYAPGIKELNHFSYHEIKNLLYYKDFKVEKREKYLSYYNGAGEERYRLDASVSYFAFSKVADRLYGFNSHALIIIILRNPVERAYSHFLMDKRLGYAKRSFHEYISSPDSEPAHFHQYISNSRYSEHVERFRNRFGDKNIIVLKLTELEERMDELLTSLGLLKLTANVAVQAKNQNLQVRYPFFRYLLRNRSVISKLKPFAPSSLHRGFNKVAYKGPAYEPMKSEERSTLERLLEKDIQYYNMLG